MISSWKDKALFTPGPLTTSRTVKQAMLRDVGSRDAEFIAALDDVRRRLVALANADPARYTAILMQGSGTFGIESVLSSVITREGALLVLVNGAYGERMVRMAEVHQIPVVAVVTPENMPVDVDMLDETLAQNPSVTHVAIVHCETTTGLINPITEVAAVARRYECMLIVDAMSSFGAYPVEMEADGIDYLISSANKCIQGVPGFSFVVARTEALLASAGHARTLTLNLLEQYKGLETDGQFRYTPPTHAILAFHQALLELDAEGGPAGRLARYARNYETALAGFAALGITPYIADKYRGCIITTFLYPDDPHFNFGEFYRRLSARGYVIYPGKLTRADCFRIGHIGALEVTDVQAMIDAARGVLFEMGITLPTEIVKSPI